jgi:hypothetical protein
MNTPEPQPDPSAADLATARELIERLVDGRLDPADAGVLDRLVCGSPAVRRFYVLSMSLHADLFMQAALLSPRMPSGGDGTEGGPAVSLDDLVIAPAIRDDAEAAPAIEPAAAGPRPAGEQGPAPRRRPWWPAAAAVLVVAGSSVVALVHGRRGQPSVAISTPVPSVPQPQVPVQPAVVATSVGSLDQSLGPVWAGVAPTAGRAVQPGDALHLRSGVARLTLASGTAVVLDGPTDVVVDTDRRLRLSQGRLTARSSHATAGFTVVTPAGSVVDVGTEFAVFATGGTGAGRRTEVVVLDGTVRVNPAGGQPGAGQTLHAPQACTITPAGVQALPKAGDPFVRSADFDRRKAMVDAAIAINRNPDLLASWPDEGDLDSRPAAEGGAFGVRWRQPAEVPDVCPPGAFVGFLDVNTTPSNRPAQHGYVGPDTLIDAAGKPLFLSWRCRIDRAAPTGFGGISLSDGDRTSVDEALFVGQPAGARTYACQARSAGRLGAAVPIDADLARPGVQPMAVDGKAHLWVLRLDFGAGNGTASVYVDPPPGREPSQANATVNVARLRFSRLRIVWGPHENWEFTRLLMGASYGSVVPR